MELPTRDDVVIPGGTTNNFVIHGEPLYFGGYTLSEDARIEVRMDKGVKRVYEHHNIEEDFVKDHTVKRHKCDGRNLSFFFNALVKDNMVEAKRAVVEHISKDYNPIVVYKEETMLKKVSGNYEYSLFKMVNLNRIAQKVTNGIVTFVNPSKGSIKRGINCGVEFNVMLVDYEGGNVKEDKDDIEQFCRTQNYSKLKVTISTWKNIARSNNLMYLAFSGDKGDRRELKHYIGFEMSPYSAVVKGYTIGAFGDEGDRFVVDYVRPDYTSTQHFFKEPLTNRYTSDVVVNFLSQSSGWRKEDANPLFNLRSSFDIDMGTQNFLVATPAVQIDAFYYSASDVGIVDVDEKKFVVGEINRETCILDIVSAKCLENRRNDLEIWDQNGYLPYPLHLSRNRDPEGATHFVSSAFNPMVSVESLQFSVKEESPTIYEQNVSLGVRLEIEGSYAMEKKPDGYSYWKSARSRVEIRIRSRNDLSQTGSVCLSASPQEGWTPIEIEFVTPDFVDEELPLQYENAGWYKMWAFMRRGASRLGPLIKPYSRYSPDDPPPGIFSYFGKTFVVSGPDKESYILTPCVGGQFFEKKGRYGDARGVPLLRGRLLDIIKCRNYLDDHMWCDIIGTLIPSAPVRKCVAT